VPERAPLILASSSPRRLALLRQAGVIPDRIVAPAVDETPLPRELPRAHVLRLAEA
jgi:septum formation protein